jgi:hypothetical protein
VTDTYALFVISSAVALALTLGARAIPVVLLDPIAARVEDAVAVANIASRRPVVQVAVAPMERPAPVTQGISVLLQGIRRAKATISAVVSYESGLLDSA